MKWVRHMLAIILLLMPAAAYAQEFPKLTGRVVDAAELLSPAQEAQLTQLSSDIEKASSRQFVVATIPDLQGYPIEDYGYRLGRAWQIGQKQANNGILLIVAPKERKVRIEVGYGLEPVMPDGMASTIVRETILPKFRDGDMAGGILAGADAIGEQMKLPLEAAEARAKASVQAERTQRLDRADDGNWLFAIFWVVVILFFVFGAAFGRRRYGRGYRSDSGIGSILLWTALDAATRSRGSSWGGGSWGGGGGSSWGGGGGFSGGGGSFGGGGASGGW